MPVVCRVCEQNACSYLLLFLCTICGGVEGIGSIQGAGEGKLGGVRTQVEIPLFHVV